MRAPSGKKKRLASPASIPHTGTSALIPGVGSSPTLAGSRSGVGATSPAFGSFRTGEVPDPLRRGQILQGFSHLGEAGGCLVVQIALVGEFDGRLGLLCQVEQEDEQHATAGDGEGGEGGQDPEHVQQGSQDKCSSTHAQERHARNRPGAVVYALQGSVRKHFSPPSPKPTRMAPQEGRQALRYQAMLRERRASSYYHPAGACWVL